MLSKPGCVYILDKLATYSLATGVGDFSLPLSSLYTSSWRVD